MIDQIKATSDEMGLQRYPKQGLGNEMRSKRYPKQESGNLNSKLHLRQRISLFLV